MMNDVSSRLSALDLQKIYEAMKRQDYQPLRTQQEALCQTYLARVTANWQKFSQDHPEVAALIDLEQPGELEVTFNESVLARYNMLTHLAKFVKLSVNSTAGIREMMNVLVPYDPTPMYNDQFIAFIVYAEAIFLKEIQSDLRQKLEQVDIHELAHSLELELGPDLLRTICGIFRENSLSDVIQFLKEHPVKLVGGEVRPHTARFIELEARLLAAEGIYVITMANWNDSVPIYLWSFLCSLLSVTGATHYTPSHSSVYIQGRKVLAGDGSQLLPEVYERYRGILEQMVFTISPRAFLNYLFHIAEIKPVGDIETQWQKLLAAGTLPTPFLERYRSMLEAALRPGQTGQGIKIRLASRADERILPTLTYEAMVALYAPYVSLDPKSIIAINRASRYSHRIILNCLGGSTWKTMRELLRQKGIDPALFEVMNGDEDSFFRCGGWTVMKSPEGVYQVDHLGIDTTMRDVVASLPYPEQLQGKKEGTVIFELDPDSDRFCIKQLISRSRIPLLEEYGIDYFTFDADCVLAAPSPNKVFLLLDIADYERHVTAGEWNDFHWLYFPTYVSARAWTEFSFGVEKNHHNLKSFVCRVGFKNLTALQKEIENWYFKGSASEIRLPDQMGREMSLNRAKPLRIVSKEEESGGRVAGYARPLMNIVGNRSLAAPEKSAADSTLSAISFLAAIYGEGNISPEAYLIPCLLDHYFKRYNLRAKIDKRIDILTGSQGAIAQMATIAERQEAEKRAGQKKNNFTNFFFSLGLACRDRKCSLDQVRAILSEVVPAWQSNWQCLSFMTTTEEPLATGSRPEGVQMLFEEKIIDGIKLIPSIIECDVRPSATDALKTKVYLDAFRLTPVEMQSVEGMFYGLMDQDLFKVLERFGIESALR